MTDRLTEQEVRELARAFHLPENARSLLEQAGLERSQQPVWTSQRPLDYWREINVRLGCGAVVDGRRQILLAASRVYPANKVFAAIAAKARDAEAGADGEPAADAAATRPASGHADDPPDGAQTAAPANVDGVSGPVPFPGRLFSPEAVRAGSTSASHGRGRPTRRGVLLMAGPVVALGATVGAVALTRQGGSGQAADLPDVQNAAVWAAPVRGARPLGPTLHGHSESVFSVAFSPDGTTLVSGSDDHSVRLWDVRHPETAHALGRPLTTHSAAVTSVAFTPGRPIMASGGADGAVELWSLADPSTPRPLWDPRQPLADPDNPLFAVAFSPNGTILATAGQDHSVRLWDVTRPAQPRPLGQPLPGHDDTVRALAFSRDGKILASAGADRTVRLWDLDDRKNPRGFDTAHITHDDAIWTVAFDPRGRFLASASGDATIRLHALE
ncbi:WD domain, G-beta repeat-containing protein [Frankia torreyi]|uniref:WD domain, G-beta repeat-containing protein n=3 Tax=Frankia TaxID=1854 RepID=A0A0D8B9C7_9ACTN|nr:WD domain, G-beta repeat-containing protein [Frankia torreyi]KQM02891.1 WD domain, G-beta repeat-containing protein [Frankia sp. CpI1-P]